MRILHAVTRAIGAALLGLVLSLAGPSSALQAQTATGAFGVLVGATFPSGDLNDELETGFNLGVTLRFSPALVPVGFRFDAAWQQLSFDHTGHGSEDLRIVAGTANAQLDLPLPFTPYAIGGVGIYNLRDPHLSGDENEFGWNLGIGMRIPVIPLETFGELRFHRISREDGGMTLVPITLGIMF